MKSSAKLVDELELTCEDLYSGRGFTAFTDLFQLYAAVNMPKLKDRPQSPCRARVRTGGGYVERDSRRRCVDVSSLSDF